MAKHREPLIKENAEYPGGVTWVDLEYDPHFQKKVRFARTKAICLWLRDHVLAGVLIAVVSLIAGIYIGQWLQPSQQQTQPDTKSSHPAS